MLYLKNVLSKYQIPSIVLIFFNYNGFRQDVWSTAPNRCMNYLSCIVKMSCSLGINN